MSVLVVGKGSFLAHAVKKISPDWVFLSHREALQNIGITQSADVIINFAFPPEFKTGPYDPAKDIDLTLARMNHNGHYIMISSRMVYGPPIKNKCFTEQDRPKPVNAYGRAKYATEQTLDSVLEERLTILRAGNIFGAEKGRSSFFGQALKTLTEEKKIVLDIDPASKKDFLFVMRFAHILMKIAADPKPGVFNVGSGIALETGEVARWLIEGYGEGELVVTGNKKDSFRLDSSKLHKTYDITPCGMKETREVCMKIAASYK